MRAQPPLKDVMEQQADKPAAPISGTPISVLGLGVPRRMQPPATRRAVAFAIELEHTHDRLQRLIGHSLPLGARIAHLNATRTRPGRLSLPRVLDAAALDRLIQERALAVELLRPLFEDDGTIGDEGVLSALRLINQAALWGEVEQRPAVKRRKRIHVADRRTLRTPEENLQADIARSADVPETEVSTPPSPRPTWSPQELPRGAYAIDIMTEGLLIRCGVNRKQLYEELQAIAQEERRGGVGLASPAMRSNNMRTLRSLGQDFPPAIFNLRGQSLDAARIDLRIERPGGTTAWTYRGGNGPTLTTTDMLRGERIDGFHLQPLATALRDPTLHPALLTKQADRRMLQEGGEMVTSLILFPRFTHLDAPETPSGVRPAIAPAQPPAATLADHMRLRTTIANRLYVHDLHHRFRLNRKDRGIYEIVVGEQSEPNPLHRYVLSSEDIEAGDKAIAARVDEIAGLVKEAQTRRLEQQVELRTRQREQEGKRDRKERRRLEQEVERERDRLAQEVERERRRVFNERMEKARDEARLEQKALIERLASSPSPQRSTRSLVILQAFGEKAATDHHESSHIDAMVRTLCDNDWKDVAKAHSNQVEMVLEEGVLIVAAAKFADITYQRTGMNRHAGGIINVIGTFVIPGQTTEAWIDARRDGRINDLFNWEGALGVCQIVRMHQAEDGIHVVARLTVSPSEE